jgi:hypothetical protein
VDLDFCDLEGGVAGIAANSNSTIVAGLDVLDQDPLFANSGGGDFSLSAGSPCIDSGNDAALASDTLDIDGDGDVLEVVPLDLAGQARELDDPGTADTGLGNAPITDMGALEK